MQQVLIVPIRIHREFTAELPLSKRHQDEIHAFGFQVSDEPLHHGDAASLAHGTETRLNSFPPASFLEAHAPELFPFVADQVFRVNPDSLGHAIKQGLHRRRGKALFEHPNFQDTPGVMVQNDHHPPAERLVLGQ